MKKKKKVSTKELIIFVFLGILVCGACWYYFFYTPLQNDIADLNAQASDVQAEIDITAQKIALMQSKEEEINKLLEEDPNPSEIAAYDNSQNVMNQLNDILAKSENYSITFSNPATDSNGIVRRSVALSFSSKSYDDAKAIILALEENHWRCIVNTVNFNGKNSTELFEGGVSVSASVVFIESTKLEANG